MKGPEGNTIKPSMRRNMEHINAAVCSGARHRRSVRACVEAAVGDATAVRGWRGAWAAAATSRAQQQGREQAGCCELADVSVHRAPRRQSSLRLSLFLLFDGKQKIAAVMDLKQ